MGHFELQNKSLKSVHQWHFLDLLRSYLRRCWIVGLLELATNNYFIDRPLVQLSINPIIEISKIQSVHPWLKNRQIGISPYSDVTHNSNVQSSFKFAPDILTHFSLFAYFCISISVIKNEQHRFRKKQSN
jgi:hypothetical protein